MPGRLRIRLGQLQLANITLELGSRPSFSTVSHRVLPTTLSRNAQVTRSQGAFPSRSGFCTTNQLLKKKKGGNSSEYDARSSGNADSSQGSVDDFSELQSKINQQLESLRETLTRVSASGGRGVSPEMLERILVEVKTATEGNAKGGKKAVAAGNGGAKEAEKVKLGDLATVLPRGQKMLVVIVHDVAVRSPGPLSPRGEL